MTDTLHYNNCQIFIHTDLARLSAAAARHCCSLIASAIKARGRCHIALAGGSTPKNLYSLLATPAFSEMIQWNKVYIYFGDERYVSHADPASNFKMAQETFLSKVNIPQKNVFPIPTATANAEADAQSYEKTLTKLLPQANQIPVFDLILLGMGDDGHTASLFPDTSIINENQKLVASVYVPRLDTMRISLTIPIINTARTLLFLISGKSKAERLASIVHKTTEIKVPLEMLKPAHKCYWYVDAAAASQLDKIV